VRPGELVRAGKPGGLGGRVRRRDREKEEAGTNVLNY